MNIRIVCIPCTIREVFMQSSFTKGNSLKSNVVVFFFCIPLKFGLILASYPEVLPISLSKKSEGDMGLGADRAAASASLEAARLCQ